LTPAKKKNQEWWLLGAALTALAVGLILRFVADLGSNSMQFVEGLCIGLSIALLLVGLIKVRRDARHDSGRA
jgi:hypothetical protein